MDVTTALLQKILGFDGVVGTNGEYQSINDAVAAGWNRIFVQDGAFLSADLTLSYNSGFIVCPGYINITGNYTLNITADDYLLAGFKMSNNAGKGIYVTGNAVKIRHVAVLNCSTIGIHLNGSSGRHRLEAVYLYGNGSDGLKIEAANLTSFSGCVIQSNTEYGVNDLTNAVLGSTSWVTGNSGGQISGTSENLDDSVVTNL